MEDFARLDCYRHAVYHTSDNSGTLLRVPLIPGHGEREILGLLRSGLNLPLSTFRRDQRSK
jgi:hypothetical protein